MLLVAEEIFHRGHVSRSNQDKIGAVTEGRMHTIKESGRHQQGLNDGSVLDAEPGDWHECVALVHIRNAREPRTL